jgi:hypothetical protein
MKRPIDRSAARRYLTKACWSGFAILTLVTEDLNPRQFQSRLQISTNKSKTLTMKRPIDRSAARRYLTKACWSGFVILTLVTEDFKSPAISIEIANLD